MSAKHRRLVDQEKALESFFDSLLRDVEAYAEQESDEQSISEIAPVDDIKSTPTRIAPVLQATSAKTDNVKPVTVTVVETPAPSIFETLPAVASPEIIEETVAVEQVKVTEADVTPAVTPRTGPPVVKVDPGKPAWADSDFQAMLFKVAGLTLAVPLVDLNGVIEWDDERVTEMPGHADFYLGLMNHLGKNVPLVDTARLVLPPDKLRVLAGDNPLARLTRIVLIHDSDYGLACDEVNEVVTLKPDDVRWRTSRTQRCWLAGTVIEHMCALIDADAFADLLRSRASIEAFRD